MKKNIVAALLILFIVACHKDGGHPQAAHAVIKQTVTMQVLAGDTGQVWQAFEMYWDVMAVPDSSNPKPPLNQFKAYPTQQKIKFKPDSTYQCTDSIARLLSIPANGKYDLDSSYMNPIHINGKNSTFPFLQTYLPLEGQYKGMLALSDTYPYTTSGFSYTWSTMIWFKRINK